MFVLDKTFNQTNYILYIALKRSRDLIIYLGLDRELEVVTVDYILRVDKFAVMAFVVGIAQEELHTLVVNPCRDLELVEEALL